MEEPSETNSVPWEADAMEALNRMQRGHQDGLIVLDNGIVRGVQRVADLADFLHLRLELESPSGDDRSRRQLVEALRASI